LKFIVVLALNEERRHIFPSQYAVPVKKWDYYVHTILIVSALSSRSMSNKTPEEVLIDGFGIAQFDEVMKVDPGIAEGVLESFIGFVASPSHYRL
jgi:hypothetical protein